ncbi:hypothetical protein R1sor_000573 [Riccia sorocarpa]|uniref:Uncharacterized protein n=1 Tax=Riccia sorocarpa TaxID=122646 RepID=A0ABD3GV74_9MARC
MGAEAEMTTSERHAGRSGEVERCWHRITGINMVPEELDKRAMEESQKIIWDKETTTTSKLEDLSCWRWEHSDHSQNFKTISRRDIKDILQRVSTLTTLRKLDIGDVPEAIWKNLWESGVSFPHQDHSMAIPKARFLHKLPRLQNGKRRRRPTLKQLIIDSMETVSSATSRLALLTAWINTTWADRNSKQFSNVRSKTPIQLILRSAAEELHANAFRQSNPTRSKHQSNAMEFLNSLGKSLPHETSNSFSLASPTRRSESDSKRVIMVVSASNFCRKKRRT